MTVISSNFVFKFIILYLIYYISFYFVQLLSNWGCIIKLNYFFYPKQSLIEFLNICLKYLPYAILIYLFIYFIYLFTAW